MVMAQQCLPTQVRADRLFGLTNLIHPDPSFFSHLLEYYIVVGCESDAFAFWLYTFYIHGFMAVGEKTPE